MVRIIRRLSALSSTTATLCMLEAIISREFGDSVDRRFRLMNPASTRQKPKEVHHVGTGLYAVQRRVSGERTRATCRTRRAHRVLIRLDIRSLPSLDQ